MDEHIQRCIEHFAYQAEHFEKEAEKHSAYFQISGMDGFHEYCMHLWASTQAETYWDCIKALKNPHYFGYSQDPPGWGAVNELQNQKEESISQT